MKILYLLMTTALLLPSQEAIASGMAEARETARQNNCTPKKVELYKQSIGVEGRSFYKVACVMGKEAGDSPQKKADALLVECSSDICSTIRSLSSEDK